jgi:hypothetical protein
MVEWCELACQNDEIVKSALIQKGALTAKGAPIVNPIVNLIAGIKLSQSQALNVLLSP